jgi:hypothetical protein
VSRDAQWRGRGPRELANVFLIEAYAPVRPRRSRTELEAASPPTPPSLFVGKEGSLLIEGGSCQLLPSEIARVSSWSFSRTRDHGSRRALRLAVASISSARFGLVHDTF